MVKKIISIILVLSLITSYIPENARATSTPRITRLFTDKSRYLPNEEATITVELKNETSSNWTGNIFLKVYYLEDNIYTTSKSKSVSANNTDELTFTYNLPSNDYRGYLVKAYIEEDNFETTAIDCSSDIDRYPRYGYIAEFPVNQTTYESNEMVKELSENYHINAFQFYDWMWRHDQMIKRTNGSVDSTWTDLFGRIIDSGTISDLISSVKQKNAVAMAYVMSYAAREGYDSYGVTPSSGLYTDRNHKSQLNVDFGDQSTYLWLFNPKDINWQNYIINQYEDSINTLDFDGLQIDQMGERNDLFDYYGKRVYLEDTFSDLVNATKDSVGDSKEVTFNIVDGTSGGWALKDVSMNAKSDFNFSEIWWKSNYYNDIKNYIEEVRKNSKGKALVLAAYMNYNDNTGLKFEAENGILNSVNINNNHQGYTGSGFVDGFAEIGDYIEFNVNVSEDGLYPLVFRYSNNTGVSSSRNVYVDGVKIGKVEFKDLNSWESWSHLDSFIPVNLVEGSHTIKIAYDSENSGAINLDSLTFGEFDSDSVRLANATFAASGAFHIELGANKNHATMLPHEYYASLSKTIRYDLRRAMMEHYDFITAYENLLFDPDINFGDQGIQFIDIENESITGDGENGKIWSIFRQKNNYDIIHLINLTGENDKEWRNSTNSPVTKSNLKTKYYISEDKNVTGVYVASPDIKEGLTKSVNFTTGLDNKGKYVEFTLEELRYWDMVYIKSTGNSPVDGVYEAENAIKDGVSRNNNHYGYSGTGFIDNFETEGDSISFNIEVESEQEYTLDFRYANSTGDQATRAVFVDGKFVGKVYMDSLSNWDEWGHSEIGVKLSKGKHQIVLLYGQYEENAINLDYLHVVKRKESARSLYLNNWSNLVAIWKDTYLNKEAQLMGDGPGLYELRYYEENENDDYNQNQIDNYSTFIRNETDGIKYTNGEKFRSTGYFGPDGILYNNYITYDGINLTPHISKAYLAIPNENFIITKYSIENRYNTTKTFKILDMLNVNNEGSGNITGTYNSQNKYSIINMQASDQYIIAHGTLENNIDAYQVADNNNMSKNSSTCSPWVTFDDNGTLKNNSSVSASDISTGLMKEITLLPGEERSFYFYIAIASNSSDINETLSRIKSHSGEYWGNKISNDYMNWLNIGKRTDFTDSKLNDAYDAISVTLKQSIVPGKYVEGNNNVYKYAAMSAATNPSAYSYKVWARDSAVSAMALDATGHFDEAESYWNWLADRQIKTDQGGWKKPGTFWTCYWIWNNNPVSFVEPEYDSIGMFLVGAYRHYEALPTSARKQKFLDRIWDSYRMSAEFVKNNIADNGFGVADCSIWEEATEYNAFTQALYIAGMDAAQIMAKEKGEIGDADNYNGAAATMRSAVQRDSNGVIKGLWNPVDGRYNRAVSISGEENALHDSSSNVLISYGIVDAKSSKAKKHIDSILEYLEHDGYGIARYDEDGFYHNKPWDPGGDEALELEPSWPQMSMWVAMYEIQSGYKSYKANAYRRLIWFVDRTAIGYMPQGEAVSNVTKKPAISTMVEPITGASFLITALAYEGKFDMRVIPPQYNVGSYKNLGINPGCNNDWQQWYDVPYFKDEIGDDLVGDSDYDIDKVYVANDSNNLYIRIDNVSHSLPHYNDFEKFAVYVYSQDYNYSSQTKNVSYTGGNLTRNMSFAFARYSDSNNYSKFKVSSGNWLWDKHITSLISPQWEKSSGRIELVIPFNEISSSGYVNDGAWANMDIVLVKQTDASQDIWTDSDTISIHYRKTGNNYEWIYGNID